MPDVGEISLGHFGYDVRDIKIINKDGSDEKSNNIFSPYEG